MNSRLRALLVVLLVWAVIYPPALGSLAIKGEEGRRILPAIRMLETGNYIVPQVGSNPYYRKPPLVNWLVAASFETFGVRNEWTARLPSVVSVLAVAIAFVIVARASLTPKGSMLAALIWMTNIGIIEKGRLIEIEALYVSLCGLAIIFWLSFWIQTKSAWLIWIPASIFLGLGLLTKGPTHLAFFYAIVLAALWQTKLARAFGWGIAVPFLAVSLVPGAVPRYTMPALVPASWLLAMSYACGALHWPHGTGAENERIWAKVVSAFVGLGLVIGGIGYPVTGAVLKNG